MQTVVWRKLAIKYAITFAYGHGYCSSKSLPIIKPQMA